MPVIRPDYDDVGAMAVMHALADRGEVKPLAVIASNKNPLIVPTIEILNTCFGRPELTIAAPKGQAPDMGASQKWPEMLAGKYPHKIKSSEEAAGPHVYLTPKMPYDELAALIESMMMYKGKGK